jgi:hypothetical protein
MKTFKLRKLFLASSAVALVMLFGCSSSEEESSDTSGGGSHCADECALAPDHKFDECMITCEA